MISFKFTGFPTSFYLIHNNPSCSKSGTKEVWEDISFLIVFRLMWFLAFWLFYSCRHRASAWICLCGPLPFTLWVPVSVWLVQHHRLQRSVSRPAQSVHHSTKGGPGSSGAEENCEWGSRHKLIGERKYLWAENAYCWKKKSSEILTNVFYH